MIRTQDARILVLAMMAAAALCPPARAAEADPPKKQASDAGGYVGSQGCVDCHEHEERSRHLQLTLHGKTPLQGWDGAQGCETCHGPGEGHVKTKGKSIGMVMPTDLPAEEQSELCMSCHERGDHAFWQGGAHDGRNLSCLSCHVMHPEKGEISEALLSKGSVFDTCTSCHLQRKATLARSSHMPLREGQMTCTSCHNPHGGVGPSQLIQLSVNENCYSCHTEKRSPVLWEHPPVKESCLNCHDPHGTMHPNLLKMRAPRLCQQCHDEARHPTQPYDSAQSLRGNAPYAPETPYSGEFFPSTRLINHGCANCHSNIHGSNHPAGVRFNR
jgi:DmsE family decaheme c-type cytochrome